MAYQYNNDIYLGTNKNLGWNTSSGTRGFLKTDSGGNLFMNSALSGDLYLNHPSGGNVDTLFVGGILSAGSVYVSEISTNNLAVSLMSSSNAVITNVSVQNILATSMSSTNAKITNVQETNTTLSNLIANGGTLYMYGSSINQYNSSQFTSYQIGNTAGLGNMGQITFTYNGSNNASNSLLFGITGKNILGLFNTGNILFYGEASGPSLKIINATIGSLLSTSISTAGLNIGVISNAYATGLVQLGANMVSGDSNNLIIGRSLTTYNDSQIRFYYFGNGSTSNSLKFGTNGIDTLMTLRYDQLLSVAKISTGSLEATGISVTNLSVANLALGSSISIGSIQTTSISSANISIGNVFSTNISAANANITSLSSTVSTIGSIFTSGGNVGINTTTPLGNFHNIGTFQNDGDTNLSGSLDTFTQRTGLYNLNSRALQAMVSGGTLAVDYLGKHIYYTPGTEFVGVSKDYGQTFNYTNANGSAVSLVATSYHGYYSLLANDFNDGYLVSGSSFGSVYTQKDQVPLSGASWYGLSVSGNGQYQTAMYMKPFSSFSPFVQVATAGAMKSSDFGVTFNTFSVTAGSQVTIGSASNIPFSCFNYTGQYQIVLLDNLYNSSDFGTTWVKNTTVGNVGFQWGGCDMSYTGQYQAVSILAGFAGVWVSQDYGSTWNFTLDLLNADNLSRILVSASGKYMTAFGAGLNSFYYSSDYGLTWTQSSNSQAGEVTYGAGSKNGKTLFVRDNSLLFYKIEQYLITSGIDFAAGIQGFGTLTNSGRIGYSLFSDNVLDIVGAGPSSLNVRLYDNLTITQGLTVGTNAFIMGSQTIVNDLLVNGQISSANTTFTNISSSNINSTHISSANANLVNITSTNTSSATANLVNLSATNISSQSAFIIDSQTIGNGLYVNTELTSPFISASTMSCVALISGRINSTNILLSNLTCPTIITTNLSATNSRLTNISSPNAFLDNVLSTNISSQIARLTNIFSTNISSSSASIGSIFSTTVQATSQTVSTLKMTSLLDVDSAIINQSTGPIKLGRNGVATMQFWPHYVDGNSYIQTSNSAGTDGTFSPLIFSPKNNGTPIMTINSNNVTLPTSSNLIVGGSTSLGSLYVFSNSTIGNVIRGKGVSGGESVALYLAQSNSANGSSVVLALSPEGNGFYKSGIRFTRQGSFDVGRFGILTNSDSGSPSNATTESVSVALNGFVGINNTNPSVHLDVVGTVKSSGGFQTISGTFTISTSPTGVYTIASGTRGFITIVSLPGNVSALAFFEWTTGVTGASVIKITNSAGATINFTLSVTTILVDISSGSGSASAFVTLL